jgi:hypothetical protein
MLTHPPHTTHLPHISPPCSYMHDGCSMIEYAPSYHIHTYHVSPSRSAVGSNNSILSRIALSSWDGVCGVTPNCTRRGSDPSVSIIYTFLLE